MLVHCPTSGVTSRPPGCILRSPPATPLCFQHPTPSAMRKQYNATCRSNGRAAAAMCAVMPRPPRRTPSASSRLPCPAATCPAPPWLTAAPHTQGRPAPAAQPKQRHAWHCQLAGDESDEQAAVVQPLEQLTVACDPVQVMHAKWTVRPQWLSGSRGVPAPPCTSPSEQALIRSLTHPKMVQNRLLS